MQKLSLREKSILAGLYLSKFDFEGLEFLGFENFTEAYNVIGLSLSIKPASIKNYRDEFDPLFPNKRVGRHKREIRKCCKDIYNNFHALNLVNFSSLLKKIIYKNHDTDLLMEQIYKNENSFAKRLITGQAAERYFRDNFSIIDIFSHYRLVDTTMVGCGFDFKLVPEDNEYFLGVEVKGLNEASGNISLTNKEYIVADYLKERYFVFVVKNFKEKPFHEIYQNPLGNMNLTRVENTIIQINWNMAV